MAASRPQCPQDRLVPSGRLSHSSLVGPESLPTCRAWHLPESQGRPELASSSAHDLGRFLRCPRGVSPTLPACTGALRERQQQAMSPSCGLQPDYSSPVFPTEGFLPLAFPRGLSNVAVTAGGSRSPRLNPRQCRKTCSSEWTDTVL